MTPVGIVITSIVPYMLLLIGLGLTVFTDVYISGFHKKLIILILTLTASLILQNALDFLLAFGKPDLKMQILVSIYGYAARPAIIVLFCFFVSRGKNIVAWVLVGMNAALYSTALFSDITFTYYNQNHFVRGPLGFTCHIVSAVLLFYLLCLVIREYSSDKRKMIFPIAGMLMIVVGVLADTFIPDVGISMVSALTIAIVISCIFHYFWLHLQSVHQYETNLMTQQRIKIMISQIQPHFLYNTIATFRALCKKNPDKAAQVAEKFGLYLRQNLDSLNSENLIPFEKEIEHTKIYADIEMVRFENVLVEYDIQDTDFLLPPLTVQPMVENAIRHGVRIRQEGVVSVSTFLSDNSHVIVIRDNGIGFDESKIDRSGGEHIGIQNVKERMEKLCGGTLTIESVPDEGTTVTIRIPAEAKP